MDEVAAVHQCWTGVSKFCANACRFAAFKTYNHIYRVWGMQWKAIYFEINLRRYLGSNILRNRLETPRVRYSKAPYYTRNLARLRHTFSKFSRWHKLRDNR
jgi:hypothetical protein